MGLDLDDAGREALVHGCDDAAPGRRLVGLDDEGVAAQEQVGRELRVRPGDGERRLARSHKDVGAVDAVGRRQAAEARVRLERIMEIDAGWGWHQR